MTNVTRDGDGHFMIKGTPHNTQIFKATTNRTKGEKLMKKIKNNTWRPLLI